MLKLTRTKAWMLLMKLHSCCVKNNIALPKDEEKLYLVLANIILKRYKYVILIDGKTKLLCNNPKYLKKWALFRNIKSTRPLRPI